MRKLKEYFQLREISASALLEEADHLKLIYLSILTVAVILALVVVWACFTKVSQTAIAYGEVVPSGPKQVVQHLEGGIVAKIQVKNGDLVKEGQILLSMSPVHADEELKQVQSRELSLILDAARLQSFTSQKSVDLDHWAANVLNSKFKNREETPELKRIVQEKLALLKTQIQQRDDQRSVLESQMAQQKSDIQQFIHDKEVHDKNLALYKQEYAMYQKLSNAKVVSQKDYITLERMMNTVQGERDRVVDKIQRIEQEMNETKNRYKQLNSDFRERAMKEFNDVNVELRQVKHTIARYDDRVHRLDVKSPVAGFVKGLELSEGSVVSPGGTLLEIVPKSRDLIVEAKVRPRDVGQIQEDDSVKIKVTSYDYSRYGSIQGKLTNLSASTFTDSDQKPYYKATIALPLNYIGSNPNKNRLKPGMTVEAAIMTGEHSIMSYLLRPIHNTVSNSFRER